MIRNKGYLSLPALLAGSLLLSCAGTHPAPRFAWDPQTDFAPMKTYAWDSSIRIPHGDSIIDGRFIDERVRAAVDSSFHAKKFERSDDGSAAILVSYWTDDTGLSDEVKDPNYAWLTGYEVTMYEKSRTITIDMRDPSKKLLWRGSITRLEGESPEAVGRTIDHDIAVLMQHFPPR